ncbi:hypothetical protein QFC19_002705 [Naganishia cerealis]|uniref:Uncharacterized protein n=1 Tax=Naganishia cerealis TaxID=610337 RepID=A0ACC2W7Q1_9TREE|nr:hypothetical protein QFC19_002705 [Naganishia cerealis]
MLLGNKVENKVLVKVTSHSYFDLLHHLDPDASYVNNDVAFASRPLASRVLSTASVVTQTQALRKVPSNDNARGYSLAPEQAAERRRTRTADGVASSSRNILAGLPGLRQERDRPPSRITDRTTGSDKGKERDAGERPQSASSSLYPREQRRLKAGEADAGVREGRQDRHRELPVRGSHTPSDMNSEVEPGNAGDKDRNPGFPRKYEKGERERYQPRDENTYKDRKNVRAGNSTPETPVSIDDESANRRDTIRQDHSKVPQGSEEERLLDGVPLEVQEAWICEDLGYALQVTEVEQQESDEEQDEDEDFSEDEEEKAIRARFGLAVPTGELDTNKYDGPGPIIGGEVLGVLLEKEILRSGDPTASALFSSLQLHASQPYAKMLLRWITTGLLHDPYQEFMVKVDDTIEKAALETDFNDDYWERRYTLRDGSSSAIDSRTNADRTVPFLQLPTTGQPELRPGTDRLPGGACIPPFLEDWKVKILRTGKYLNVIRECGLPVEADQGAANSTSPPESENTVRDGLISMEETKFYRIVDHAYMTANQRLLDLMLKEKGLIPYLRSMKHFFFLDQSEFMSQFIDNASTEFKKSVKSVSMIKIQSLLYMAITNPASPTSLDPNKDDLRATVATSGLFEWLGTIVNRQSNEGQEDGTFLPVGDETKQNEKGKKDLLLIEALSIDFDVKFPLSLVISRKAITRYQLVFRFLLNLKYLESLLTSMWMEHRQVLWRTRLEAPDMERWKRRIYNLRAQMLQWVQQMLTFTTQDVLEANWKRLEAKLAKVQTVDQLIQDHVDYLDVCLKECMLTTDRLLPVSSLSRPVIGTGS